MLQVNNVRCEYLRNPIGLDVKYPRISWQITSDERDIYQTAYQIQVAKDMEFNDIIHETDYIESDQSAHITLKQLEVKPWTRYFYRIRVWNQENHISKWSKVKYWETGFISTENWVADWISAPENALEKTSEACPLFHRAFKINKKVTKARIYATSLGLYEVHLNGKRVGDSYFTPGWTSYETRLQYQAYDVTHLLDEGGNAIGMTLGNGWYKGSFNFKGKKAYGDRLASLLELHVTYEDGQVEKIVTNDSWKCSTGPVLKSEIYHGEIYDARLEVPNWSYANAEVDNWGKVQIMPYSKDQIVAQRSETVQKIETIKPKTLFQTPDGDTVMDMGQNMVGWMKFVAHGKKGEKVTLRHAEILDKHGNFYTGNLRTAEQKITYILKGSPHGEIFEPHFTFQGFRYVQIEGFPESIELDDFTGVVLHSNMESTGTFECSNPMINQLHHNIIWGQKGNFLDVPTDCPQRDERLGWTGDAHMFIRTASYLMNVAPFFTKWLKDLEADQHEHGGVPYIIPDILEESVEVLGGVTHSVTAWGDAAVICPWTLYLCYGDTRVLQDQYNSMKKWVNYMRNQGTEEVVWDTGFQLGDWLGLDSEPDTYTGATDKTFIANVFFAYSSHLLAKTAEVLGYDHDKLFYQDLSNRIKLAFQEKNISADGDLLERTQTAHVLTLAFDMIDENRKTKIAAGLVELIKEKDYHLTTGFVGTPYLNLVLSDYGYHDVACKLLLQEDYPSWLYQITKGATTVWEHWDSIRPDGSLWSDNMNSFNHYAYGSIGEWLYRKILGIDTDDEDVAYKHIRIKPMPGAGLDWVKGSLDSMYGKIHTAWKQDDNNLMEVKVTIPTNTTASVFLPNAKLTTLKENGQNIADVEGIHGLQQDNQHTTLNIGSGDYFFKYPLS